MAYLPDTSVVLRLSQPHHPMNSIVGDCIAQLENEGEEIFIVPQICVEFWAVATRPTDVNGLGFSIEEAEREIQNLQKLFRVLPEDRKIFNNWQNLVVKYKVSGKVTHDARIVAAMMTHKIENILTLNPNDFKRFTEIEAHKPQDILDTKNNRI